MQETYQTCRTIKQYPILSYRECYEYSESQTDWICALQSCAAAGAGFAGPAVEATGGGRSLLKGAELSKGNSEISRNKICKAAPCVSRTPIGMAPRDKELHACDLKSLRSAGSHAGSRRAAYSLKNDALAECSRIKGFIYGMPAVMSSSRIWQLYLR